MEGEFGMGEAWEGTRELMPGDGTQDGVMSPTGVEEIHFPVTDLKGSLALNEMAVKSGGITLFKTAQMAGEHRIEGIGHHGHEDIKMDLDQDRRG